MNRMCSQCGASLRPKQKFCAKCGAKVEDLSGVSRTKTTSNPLSHIQTKPPKRERWQRPQRIKTGPLFVLPASLSDSWGRIEKSIPRIHHGNQLIIDDPLRAGDSVRAWLLENPSKTTMICLIGDDHALAHDRISNNLMLILEGQDPEILCDLYFGRAEGIPAEEDRFESLLDPQLIPVSRIPTTDINLITRLLAVGDDLPRSWRGGLVLQAEQFAKWSDGVVSHICKTERPQKVVCPPSSYTNTAQIFATQPSRVYCLVHGGDNNPQWYGHSVANNRCEPVALSRNDVDVATHAIVISQACYGAVIDDPLSSISLQFLNKGASAFVGSTIIAWGGGLEMLASEHIPATVFANLDNGLPLATALLEAKRAIARAAVEFDESACYPTHNTLHSFVAYGAPWARVQFSSRSGKATTLAQPPKQREAYQSQDVIGKWRNTVRTGSTGQKHRERVRERLPREIWNTISNRRIRLSEISQKMSSYQAIHEKLQSIMNDLSDNIPTRTYHHNGQQYALMLLKSKNAESTALVSINREGEILQQVYQLSYTPPCYEKSSRKLRNL